MIMFILNDVVSTFRLMPESALTAPKEKKLTGRQWFESGRATAVSQVSLSVCADAPKSNTFRLKMLLIASSYHQ